MDWIKHFIIDNNIGKCLKINTQKNGIEYIIGEHVNVLYVYMNNNSIFRFDCHKDGTPALVYYVYKQCSSIYSYTYNLSYVNNRLYSLTYTVCISNTNYLVKSRVTYELWSRS